MYITYHNVKHCKNNVSDDQCQKKGDLISCSSYMDKNNMIQRKCKCQASREIQSSVITINGCGDKMTFNSFLKPKTISCCNLHDICMSKVVDSGVCANEFSACLKKVQDFTIFGIFKRNMMDHAVRTSSYQFILRPQGYSCHPIEATRLKTLQSKEQQRLWSLAWP